MKGVAKRACTIPPMSEANCIYPCFAGLVMMQLAVPKLRSTSALKTFNKSFQACKCDLDAWRERERLAPAQAAFLDADDGAGWELAQALLRPRKLEVSRLTGISTMLLRGRSQALSSHTQCWSRWWHQVGPCLGAAVDKAGGEKFSRL